MSQEIETNDSIATGRYLNRSAVKEHALRCSNKLRAGYFTRVSQEFIDDVQAEAERILKAAIALHQNQVHDIVLPDTDQRFVTGAFVSQAETIYNALVPRIVQSKVQRHPTTGCTLKR